MCIIFLIDHPDHYGRHPFSLGVYACEKPHCPPATWLRFYLEDSNYGCPTCIAIDEEELDPDIAPVQYYPPAEDFDIAYVREGRFDRVVRVSRDVSVRSEESRSAVYSHNEGSLSDVNSETSHWKEDWNTDEEDRGCSDEASLYREEHAVPSKGTQEARGPGAAQHRDITRHQLNGLPQHAVPEDTKESTPSPNTTQHRNLVQQQLAKLPIHLAHCRQPTDDPLYPTMPPVTYYDPLLEATLALPIPTPFYDGTPDWYRNRSGG